MKICRTCQRSYPDHFANCPQDGTPLTQSGGWTEGTLILGKYRILGKIGQGAMGAVYKALHVRFNELRAIKVMMTELASHKEFVKRFEHEAVFARKLHHPNAVSVEDIDETDDGQPFIVMEYIEGQSLRNLMKSEGPLSARRVSSIIKQVAAALDAAHQIGIVHRDIKPDNILISRETSREIAKVLDFGIARIKEGLSETSGLSLTHTGMVIGTPFYMSPEQAKGISGDQLDARSDIYSLGVVMYQMLTGELPVKGDTPLQVLFAHVQTPPIPFPVASPDLDIPKPITDLVMECLSKDPAQRPQTGQALIENLESWETARTQLYSEAKPAEVSPAAGIPKPKAAIKQSTAPLSPVDSLLAAEVEPGIAEHPAQPFPDSQPHGLQHRNYPIFASQEIGQPVESASQAQTIRSSQPLPTSSSGKWLASAVFAIILVVTALAYFSSSPSSKVDKTGPNPVPATAPSPAQSTVEPHDQPPLPTPLPDAPEAPKPRGTIAPATTTSTQTHSTKGVSKSSAPPPTEGTLGASPKPLSKDDIIRLLKGDVSPKRVEELIRERGINFQDTPEAEQDLRQAGADSALFAVVGEVAPNLFLKGESYYKAGLHEQALPLFRQAAESNDRRAAAYLGLIYEKGLGGLPKDDAQTVNWYRKAADAGDARGMSGLGFMYEKGRGGLPKDDAKAVSWYRKAADAGDPRGMSNLAGMYADGRGGLPQDDVLAVSWSRKAADAGDPHGMSILGFMYLGGQGGLAEDDAEAASWYRKAADAGDGPGMRYLGLMYLNGMGGLAKDDVQGVSWYRKAADAGDALGMDNLGMMYEKGRHGLPKDEAQAAYWYRKAADAGDAGGMFNLGAMYESGLGGLPKDIAEAASWYRKAATLGYADAKNALKRLKR
jgi:TPR repeat protein/serine/threonine protein kinase